MFVELIYILVSSKITVSHKVSPQTVFVFEFPVSVIDGKIVARDL
jgi:hypothetical protein